MDLQFVCFAGSRQKKDSGSTDKTLGLLSFPITRVTRNNAIDWPSPTVAADGSHEDERRQDQMFTYFTQIQELVQDLEVLGKTHVGQEARGCIVLQ